MSIPDDIADRSVEKASGVVELPARIAWSPPYVYDLDDPGELRSAYARVMTEGLADDVRFYIDIDTLVMVWDDMYLPRHVRERWREWLVSRSLLA